MDSTKPPDADQELALIAPLVPLLFEGMEGATEVACQFFERRGKPINSALFPALVRYEVREYLQDKGQVIDDFDQEELGNNGLCLVFAGRRIRIWKADDGSLPPPGSSRLKLQFLNQQLSLFLPDDNGDPRPIQMNLVILWNVDQNHRLKGLYLVCPKSAFSPWAAAESWWSRAIEHSVPIKGEPVRPESDITKDLPLRRLDDVDTDAQEAR